MNKVIKINKQLFILLVSTFLLIILIYIGQLNFLLTHFIIDITGTIVAITIFVIGWNTREFAKNNFMIVLSLGYLIVGFLTMFHTLTIKETQFFVNIDFNTSVQFSLVSRYLESITMVIAFSYLQRKGEIKGKFALAIVSILTAGIIYIILKGYFPVCYKEDPGLTQFKVISEYIICFMYLLSAYILWRKRNLFKKTVLYSILIAILFMLIAEIFFTLYYNYYSVINLYGHLFVLLSRILIYYAFIYYNLKRPYKVLFNNLSKYNEELTKKNQELRIKDIAIDSSINAFILMDLDNTITYANKAFLEMFDFEDYAEVIGLKATVFIRNEEKLSDIIDSLKATGNWKGEITVHSKKGEVKYFFLTLNYVYSDAGELSNIMALGFDISIRKKTELELVEAKKQAEAANIAKSNFLANMSHEIRTPLNGIQGFLQLLELTDVNDMQKIYLKNMSISLETLLNVINDILDVSKIEAGKLKLANIEFNLSAVVKESIIPFIKITEEKNIALEIYIDDKLPTILSGDPIRIKQVIQNLVSNAIKFTDNGKISIDVTLLKQKGKKYEIEFVITDTGIGMNDEILHSIFQPFSQADISSTRKYGGTGLGLTICKTIVELMNGNIEVKSKEERGTVFIFTIWLQAAKETIEVNHIPNDKKLEILKKDIRILLVEDNEVNITFLKMFFEMNNIYLVIAKNGQEAVDLCKEHQFNIILMDCLMPIMDGFEATKIIRLNEGDNVKIIAMTALAMKGDIEKCIKVGMDDYISKPIDIEHLINIINKYSS